MSKPITLSPIGYVKNQFKENTPVEQLRQQSMQIVINPELTDGLLGLEAGTDILVLFYFHRIEGEVFPLQLHPRHDETNPLRGIFATRSQFRPSGIGATVARLEQIEENVLTVIGLDTLDETPVLDIKPYLSYFDAEVQRQLFEVRPVSSLAEARQAIDLLDAEIIRLLGHRAKYVYQVTNFKKNADEVRAKVRYEEVMQSRRKMAEAAGLNPDVIEQMYKLLVENFIKEELEILKNRKNEN